MAASNLNLGKASGGVLNIQPADGTTNTSLVLPASGTVVATDVAVTDNAIARYDGTTGKVQNSGVVIDDNGNVGVGTSSPSYKLDVNGGNGNSIIYRGTTNNVAMGFNADRAYVGTISNSSFSIDTYGTERMRIDSNGNVGIGVTPSAWGGDLTRAIEIGNAQDNGTIWSSLHQHHSHIGIGANFYMDSSFIPKYKASYAASQYKQELGRHYWETAPSGTAGNAITWETVMQYDGTGLLLNPSYATKAPYVQCFNSSSANTTYIQAQAVANTNIVFASLVGGIIKSAILANGNFQSATNSYGSTSDAKLKENVVETSDKLDKLMNVRVVNFNYIGDDQKQIGVIAQEVEKIFPGIVYETKDTKQVEVTKTKEVTDEEGNVTTEEYTETETVETGEVTKNVKYSVIYMMMLKGMQEQQAIINDLKARIEILEGAK